MRKFLKKNILEIFQTMYEAHNDIKKLIEKKDLDSVNVILGDCQNTAVQIGTAIEGSEGEGFVSVKYLEEYCETVYQVASEISEFTGSKAQKVLDKKLIKAENSVKNDIKVILEVVFLPYKASMWDSLESIWKAADADPDCNAHVIPIPYYDKKPDGSFGEMHYEGADMPEYVPIMHYEAYNLELMRPDVIYIHNPYDEYNYVTSVDPRFYSYELKKYTDYLVYSPYFIAGYYANAESASKNIPNCAHYVDLYILQSFNQKQQFAKYPQYLKKAEVLGSPKLDRVINELAHTVIPNELSSLIDNKKVIMINSSISRLLNEPMWFEKMNHIVSIFENNPELFMIWRPHPLLCSTINAMRPDLNELMNKLILRIDAMSNTYIDTLNSADVAIKVSDGLISDYSSIVLQYTATGKPVLLTVGYSQYRNTKLVCCDYFSNYFIKDGVSVENFCEMISSNQDPMYNERMKYFKDSIMNPDGSSGRKIHHYVKERNEI